MLGSAIPNALPWLLQPRLHLLGPLRAEGEHDNGQDERSGVAMALAQARPGPAPRYLTLAAEARLLQAGPDALDPPCVLGVAVGVPTGTLVFQHQGVVHEACRETEAAEVSGHPRAVPVPARRPLQEGPEEDGSRNSKLNPSPCPAKPSRHGARVAGPHTGSALPMGSGSEGRRCTAHDTRAAEEKSPSQRLARGVAHTATAWVPPVCTGLRSLPGQGALFL